VEYSKQVFIIDFFN